MSDLIWREDTIESTGGAVVGYSLWDREINRKLGSVLCSPTPDESGNWVKIKVFPPLSIPSEAQTDFNDLDEAKRVVNSYVDAVPPGIVEPGATAPNTTEE